jgi:hypothetical protein
MSNYGTTYNISQIGDLYAIDGGSNKVGLSKYNSTRGTTVNSPVNYRFLKLFQGFDNELFFFVKNQDRKPIMLQGVVINASVISRSTRAVLVNKKCIITDYEQSSIKLVITSAESAGMDNGHYDVVFSYTNSHGLTLPLYCDQNMRPNYTLEVSDAAGPVPLVTQSTEEFLTNNNIYTSGMLPGPGYYDKLHTMVTIAVYATDYTGDFYIQGTLFDNPTETDWFDIVLGTNTETQYPYYNFTGIDPWTFRTNIRWVRARFTQTSGTLDKLVVRV